MCKGMVFSDQDAEDAAQETVIEIYRSIGGLSNPFAFRARVKQIAANKCNEIGRRHLRQTEKDAKLEIAEAAFADVSADEHPQQALEKMDVRAQLMEMINRLPPISCSWEPVP